MRQRLYGGVRGSLCKEALYSIGEKIVGTNTIPRLAVAPLIGSIIYQQIQGFALAVGLAPSDLKFMTGAIVLGIITLK